MDGHNFLRSITKLKVETHRKLRRDDDLADQLSHSVTSAMLLVCTVVVSARQYAGGKAISCWVPTEFTSAQEEYAESICWVSSTYFVSPYSRSVPTDISRRQEAKLLYYQWVPFILMLQALMFNLPCLFWRIFSWQTGIHMATIVEVTNDIEAIRDRELRQSSLAYVTRYIDQALRQQRRTYTTNRLSTSGSGANRTAVQKSKVKDCFSRLTCLLWCSSRYGSYLTTLYITTKVLYLINIVGQFFLMNEFLGSSYTFYGLELLRHLITGYTWRESGNFPRVTMCDFEVRKLANKHRYTVQCVLPINMFNEKIFLFLWFWFVIVGIFSFASFLSWGIRICIESARIQYIRKFLKLKGSLMPSTDMRPSIEFTLDYLRHDGVLLIRLLAYNVGDLITAEIVERLWKMYRHGNGGSCYATISATAPPLSNEEVIIGNRRFSSMAGDARASKCQHDSTLGSRHGSSSTSHSTDNSNSIGQKAHSRRRNSGRRSKPSIQISGTGGGKSNMSLDNLEEDPGEFV